MHRLFVTLSRRFFLGINCLIFLLGSVNLSAQITGQVFKDFNANGTKEANEPLLPGVVINAYAADGSLCGTTTSSEFSDPNYSLSGCGTAPVRLEFIRPTGGCKVDEGIDFSSQGAAVYGSAVQFVNGNSTNVNYAVAATGLYSEGTAGSRVFVPCYVSGDPLAGGTAGGTDWFVGFPYGNSGTATAPDQQLDGSVIGSVWGVAYSKQAQRIFTSAFIKRHSGLGLLGTGGIYMLEPTASSFNVTQFYDLDANGTRTRAGVGAPAYGSGTSFQLSGTGSNVITYLGGVDPVSGEAEGLGVVGANGAGERNLGATSGSASADAAAFDQVGKVGLGDLEISDDGRFLFVVNLYAKSVVRMELDDPFNPTSVVAVSSFPLSSVGNLPTCTNGVLRPFGLSYRRGKIYVGAVCTNEGRDPSIPNNSDLSAHVFVLNDPTGTASYAADPIVSQTLDYNKGRSRGSQVDAFQNNNWNVWTNDFSSAFGKYAVANVYPTPMLSDIEFTDQENMILLFSDRGGHQWGNLNNNLSGTGTFSYQLGGHMVFLENDANTCNFVVENNGGTSNYLGNAGGIGNGEGPGGGEFFSGAFFTSGDNNSTPPNPFVGNHPSVAMGSGFVLPGTNEIYITSMDPAALFSGGTMQLNLTDGSKVVGSGYQLYSGGGSLSKAAGLGDIELSGVSAPLEIGNRVWNDLDGDGVQDANEPGIANVSVELYDQTSGMTVATVTTDGSGNYIFSSATGTDTGAFDYGLTFNPGNTYELRIANAEGGSQQAALSGLEVTPQNNDGTSNGDARDSDGTQGMTSVVSFVLGDPGENNHSYDFGFRMPVMCTNPTASLTGNQGTCSGAIANNDASISLSSVMNGDEANYSPGASYSGVSYGDGSNINVSGGSGSFTALIHNTQYTVRVWNGANDCFTDQTITTPSISCAAETFSLGNQVFYDDDNSGDRNGTENGIDGITLQLLNSDGSVYDSDSGTPGIQALTVITANDGYYRFDDLPAGDYIVEIVAAEFAASGFLENYISSTGAASEANPNNNGDSNDNGLDTPVAGAIRSGIISLANPEPLGETEPASYGAGSTTGTAAADNLSNLTVDFGFFRKRDRPDCCDGNRPPCTIEPCHFISNDIYLGTGVTNDTESNPSAGADTDVDDGLLLGNNLDFRPGGVFNIPVLYYNNTGANAFLRIWIDWNNDGDFEDTGEQVADNSYAASGSVSVNVSVVVPATVPLNQDVAIRARISSDDINSADPCGNGTCANDGEIEDYLMRVSCPTGACSPIGVTLIRN